MPYPLTHQTRDASYQAVLPFAGSIAERVYAVLKEARDGMTAEEVQAAVGCSLNSARSRLTELNLARRVAVVAKRRNAANTRDIAVFWVPHGEKL